MDKKNFIENTINTISSAFIAEHSVIDNFLKLINDQPQEFWGKKSNIGHITSSVLVFNENLDEVLLTHHKKFNKWLQLGGHWCDFEDFPSKSLIESGRKEVEEEGFNDQPIEQVFLLDGLPLDLDIHNVGDHSHYDVCFLSVVKKSIPVHVSHESHDVNWIKTESILNYTDDKRLVRMINFVNENKYELLKQYDSSKVKFKP